MRDLNGYVRKDEHGVYRVGNTRVMLDGVVVSFRDGLSPETIMQQYPALTLEQVYGAITFYLANREEVDAYLAKAKADFDSLQRTSREADPTFYQKLADARRHQPMVPP